MAPLIRHPEARMIAAGQHALVVPTTSQKASLPSRRVSPLREGPRVQRRGLYLGTTPDGQPLYLAPKHLRTHLHLLGATGTGKSRLTLWIYQILCHTNRPIVLIDPKGGLYRFARDWALANGFQKRLVLFDLSSDILPGYNPLRPTNLRIDLQAQYVREGVKSAWGSSTFDSTPLLARMLYLCLYTARVLSVSMLEALDVLRPSPTLRHAAIQKIGDPFVRGALVAFDNLSDRIKAEQASSTISRLEMFLCDEVVRTVICSPQSLDLEDLLAEKKIILVNFGKYQPLLPDAVKLLGRMFFNDLLAHIYKGHGEGRFDETHPCYVLCDEIQNFATKQVCDSLDEGRAIGCHMTIAHQHLSQLADEDQSGYLYHSVLTDARTKVIFPGLSPEDLQVLADILMLRHYHPLRTKHIQITPSYRPVESVREVPTRSKSNSYSQSVTENYSEADSVSHSVEHSVSRGRSIANSIGESEGESESYTQGRNSSMTESHNWGVSGTQSGSRTRSAAHTTGTAVGHVRSYGRMQSDGSTDSTGVSSASGWSSGEGRHLATSTSEGQSMLPPEEGLFFTEDPEVVSLSAHTGSTEGQSSFSGTSGMTGSSAGHAHSRMQGVSEQETGMSTFSSADTEGLSDSAGWSSGWNDGYGVATQMGESEAWSRGTNRSTTRSTTATESQSVTDGTSDSVGHTVTRGEAFTQGESITHGESVTRTPFYEYIREEIETPVFLTPEEQKLLEMQKLARPEKQNAVVITSDGADCSFRVTDVPDPTMTITKRRLAAGLAYVYRNVEGYPRLVPQQDDIIDVEVQEIAEPPPTTELSSPAQTDAGVEAALWERWKSMSHGTSALSSPTADDTDDEPVFWRPPTQRNARQEKS